MPQVRDRSLGANLGGDEAGQGPTWIVSVGGLYRTYPTVYVWLMPRGLRRFQESGHSHFVTFSCRHRQPYFSTAELFDLFVQCLEDMRVRFDVRVYGYVVMPEHVHLLLSEPAGFAQVSAQKTSANLGPPSGDSERRANTASSFALTKNVASPNAQLAPAAQFAIHRA